MLTVSFPCGCVPAEKEFKSTGRVDYEFATGSATRVATVCPDQNGTHQVMLCFCVSIDPSIACLLFLSNVLLET